MHASFDEAYFISFIPHFERSEILNFEGQDVADRRCDIVSAVGAKF